MKHFQETFDDDCYELTVLRWFRDNFVSQEDIAHYYQTAPVIVAGIDNCGESANIAYDSNDRGFMKLMMLGIYPLWSAPKHVWDTMDEFLALETVSEELPTMHGDEYLLLTGEI